MSEAEKQTGQGECDLAWIEMLQATPLGVEPSPVHLVEPKDRTFTESGGKSVRRLSEPELERIIAVHNASHKLSAPPRYSRRFMEEYPDEFGSEIAQRIYSEPVVTIPPAKTAEQ